MSDEQKQTKNVRAEIVFGGVVQGVGFRYYTLQIVEQEKHIKGFVENLATGEVYCVLEGDKAVIKALYEKLKFGPQYATVEYSDIQYCNAKNEFRRFEIRR